MPAAADEKGEPSDAWLRVKHSALPATDAFAQVRYNGYWLHIPQSDLRSKQTFALLSYLFLLQATTPHGGLPLVAVPAGHYLAAIARGEPAARFVRRPRSQLSGV